ncbi:MAG: DUF11 domain-containing protein [Verrucomicrobia bacterium]|nr:DUF11 domain-containing protein [Verrucomicrobiota bacterium]
MDSRANHSFRLDFFSNPAADPSGHGEGQTYLGSESVTTDGGGHADFSVTLPGKLVSRFVSATATDADNNTSEFSATVIAASTVPGLALTVTTVEDAGPGSLRAAILAANAAVTEGDTIAFSIPGPGPHTIAPTEALPALTDPGTTIDGYTQPGARANTLAQGHNAVLQVRIDGTSAGFNATGLRLESSSHTLRGLCLVGFRQSAIHALGYGSHTIEGNFVGVDVGGVAARGNFSHGILLENSAGNRVGWTAAASRNVVSGNSGSGVRLQGSATTDNVVLNNYVGTTASGRTKLPNGSGVTIDNAPSNRIGGSGALAGNVIAGNFGAGIGHTGNSATNNSILGNFIGTDVSGTLDMGNSSDGINLSGGGRATIGGAAPGAGNLIAFNQGDGVAVVGFNSMGQAIRGNSITDNAGLGIDLGNSGVTGNDPKDVDTGANLLQNFPVLSAATGAVAQVVISGQLQSAPNQEFVVDFYSNLVPDPSEHGEGRTHLGSSTVNTDASGNAAISVTLPATMVGRHLSATATDPSDNTSEFSPVIAAASLLPAVTLTVVSRDDAGPGSLREAILAANLNASQNPNAIRFDIPGEGPHLIEVLSPLPTPTEPVIIDGFTQPGAHPNTRAQGSNARLQVFLSGALAPFGTDGLTLHRGGVTVRGLGLDQFNRGIVLASAAGNSVEGCLVHSNRSDGIVVNNSPGNLIGGAAPAAVNVLSHNGGYGLRIEGAGAVGNVVDGNLIGTDFTGESAAGNRSGGVMISSASGNRIGHRVGNTISGNAGTGVQIAGSTATSNFIAANRIGTDVSGTTAIPNQSDGVSINGASFNTVGAEPGAGLASSPIRERWVTQQAAGDSSAGNLISGNSFNGVSIAGFQSSGNRIASNIIGAGTASAPLPNGFHGVSLSASTVSNLVSANAILFNRQDGVFVDSSSARNRLTANSIADNVGLGIDLAFDGVTPNDANDLDTGANLLQNFPVLTAAVVEAAGTRVSGTLESKPATTFRLEFFSNPLPDPSGHGEGAQFLGAADLTTDATGKAPFTLTVAAAVPIGRYIAATATDPEGNTSELSGTIEATSTLPGLSLLVTHTADSGPGSLREAILASNRRVTASQNVIAFALPGEGPHVLEVQTPLPPLTEPVFLDGFSQPGSSPNSATTANNATHAVVLSGRGLSANDQHGLEVRAPGCTLKGLRVADFPGHGLVLRSSGAEVSGCLVQSNRLNGILVEGPGTLIGGSVPARANVISGNGGNGVAIEGAQAKANLLHRNLIGTDAAGNAPLGNTLEGVALKNAPTNQILECVISANALSGVLIEGGLAGGNALSGNQIGLGLDGKTRLGNAAHGLHIDGASGTYVGAIPLRQGQQVSLAGGGRATAPRAPSRVGANRIAHNGADGIFVGSGTGNVFTGNSIWDNGELGIDLAFNGVNPNDGPGDADAGANHRQNFPTIRNVTWDGSRLILDGSDAEPDTWGLYLLDTADGSDVINVTVENFPANGLLIHADDVAVRGGAIRNSGLNGIQIVQGNLVVIGGSGDDRVSITGNRGGGIFNDGGDRLTVLNSTISHNTADGISTRDGNELLIGGTTISGHDNGVALQNVLRAFVHSSTISGNRIGINVRGGADILIGGPELELGNRLSGNTLDGIQTRGASNVRVLNNQIIDHGGNGGFFSDSFRATIQANTVRDNAAGLTFDGNPGFNHQATIGSDADLNLANLFDSNRGPAIRVLNGRGVNLQDRNLFENNLGLALDLGGDGPTPNDALDSDFGPNDLLNFPQLLTVTPLRPSQGRVVGTYSGVPFNQVTVRFFAADAGPPSGRGAPQRFLGSTPVFTDQAGFASFAVTLESPEFPGTSVLSTDARDFNGNVSEPSPFLPQTPTNDADLILGATDSPDPVVPGDSLTFNWFAYNTGPTGAVAVVLTAPLPAGAVNVIFSQSQGTATISGDNAIYNLGGLPTRQSAQGSLTYTVPPSPTTLNQMFELRSDRNDPIPSNNRVTVRTLVQDPAQPTDLSVEKTVSSPTGLLSKTLTYTIKIANHGPQPATNLELTDFLPPGFLPTSVVAPDGSPTPVNADINYVRQLYADLLGRDGLDAAGAAFAQAVESSSLDRSQVALTILSSDAYLTSLVTERYQSLLGRPPTATELSADLNHLRTDADGYEQLLCRILASDEFAVRAALLVPHTYLLALTGVLFGGPPTRPEIEAFNKLIADGQLTMAEREAFIKELLDGPEFYDESVYRFIKEHLGRKPFPDELDDYLDDLEAGVSLLELFADVLATEEYYFLSGATQGVSIPSLPPGGMTLVSVQGFLYREGALTNRAAVVGAQVDPDVNNNQAMVPAQILPNPSFGVDLALGTTSLPPTGVVGYPMQGSFPIRNITANNSTSLVVTVEAPFAADDVSLSTPNGTVTPASPEGNFVNQLYRDLLDRSPRNSDLLPLEDALRSGTLSHTDLAGALVFSEEARRHLLNDLFQDFLGRPADPAELANSFDLLATGGNHQVVRGLVTSHEYFDRVGGTLSYLNALYRDLLDRAASSLERDAFPGPFDTRQRRELPVDSILGSAEYRQQVVTDYYNRYLRRNPDTAEGEFWSRRIDIGAFDGPVLDGLIGSDDYLDRAGQRFRLEIPSLAGNSQQVFVIQATPTVRGPNLFHARVRSEDTELRPSDNRAAANVPIFAPVLEVSPATGQLSVSRSSGSDRFQAEGTSQLESPFWSHRSVPPAANNGTLLTVTLPTVGSQRFFVRLAPVFDRCLQDDTTGDQLAFNSTTGQYRLTRGNGEIFSGTATLAMNGSILTLRHATQDRLFTADLDTDTQRGQASLDTPRGSPRLRIADSNTANNACP